MTDRNPDNRVPGGIDRFSDLSDLLVDMGIQGKPADIKHPKELTLEERLAQVDAVHAAPEPSEVHLHSGEPEASVLAERPSQAPSFTYSRATPIARPFGSPLGDTPVAFGSRNWNLRTSLAADAQAPVPTEALDAEAVPQPATVQKTVPMPADLPLVPEELLRPVERPIARPAAPAVSFPVADTPSSAAPVSPQPIMKRAAQYAVRQSPASALPGYVAPAARSAPAMGQPDRAERESFGKTINWQAAEPSDQHVGAAAIEPASEPAIETAIEPASEPGIGMSLADVGAQTEHFGASLAAGDTIVDDRGYDTAVEPASEAFNAEIPVQYDAEHADEALIEQAAMPGYGIGSETVADANLDQTYFEESGIAPDGGLPVETESELSAVLGAAPSSDDNSRELNDILGDLEDDIFADGLDAGFDAPGGADDDYALTGEVQVLDVRDGDAESWSEPEYRSEAALDDPYEASAAQAGQVIAETPATSSATTPEEFEAQLQDIFENARFVEPAPVAAPMAAAVATVAAAVAAPRKVEAEPAPASALDLPPAPSSAPQWDGETAARSELDDILGRRKPAATIPVFEVGSAATPYDDVPQTGLIPIPPVPQYESEKPAQRGARFEEFDIDPLVVSRQETVESPRRPSTPAERDASMFDDDLVDLVTGGETRPAERIGLPKVEPLPPGLQQSYAEESYFPPLETPVSVESESRMRGKLLPIAFVALILAGGVAYFGFGGTGDQAGEEPAIVRADNEPVRVEPVDPGGTVVPNQDRVVFNEVAGGQAQTQPLEQAPLVDGRQEPTIAGAPVKEEDRAAGDTSLPPLAGEEVALAPRPVQTVTVRPDGTLVVNEPAPVAEAPQAEVAPQPRPADASAPVAEQPLPPVAVLEAPATQTPATETPATETPATDASIAQAPVEQAPVSSEPAVAEAPQPAPEPVIAAAPEAQPVVRQPAPAVIDGVPSRPSDQPLIAGNGASEVAAAPAAEAPATEAPPAQPASGGFVMQIASQPSEAAAQASLVDLSKRFGNILGGRAYTIQRAEVPGKGTFYRLRIDAGSRSEANALCQRYKAAGGSCFVTR
jgi:hypothetical protein